MSKKIKALRLFSMIMTLFMLFASIPALAETLVSVTSAAVDNIVETTAEATTAAIEKSNRIENVLALKKLPDDLIESAALDMSKVIAIDDADAENLESFTTINEDGSKTLYVFEAPIKYLDKDSSKIEFIDNALSELNFAQKLFGSYAYKNTANAFEVSFPKKINKGVLIDDSEFAFSMEPITVNNSAAEYKEYEFIGSPEKVVEYANAFGDGYHLQYNPISSGLKENIFVDAYNGTNTFQFNIKAQGLVPNQTEGDAIEFLDEQTGEPVYYISQTYIRDSYIGADEVVNTTEENTVQADATADIAAKVSGVNADGTKFGDTTVKDANADNAEIDNAEINGIKHISFENYYTIEDLGNYEYLLTSIVDKEFLESETTVYPVLIDPTLTIARGNILSASVFSGTSSRVINNYSTIGNLSGYGQGRTYIKTNILGNHMYINPDKITSAYYHAKEISGNAHSATVQVWDTLFQTATTSVTYSQCLNSLDGTSPKHTKAISTSATYYDIAITSLLKQWLKSELADGGYSQNYGFVLALHNGGSVNYKQFGSHLNSSYPPSIVINYSEDESLAVGTYYIKSKNSGKYLDVNGGSSSSGANVQQYQFNGSKAQQWTVTKVSTGLYELKPGTNANLRLDVAGGVYNNGINIQVYTSNSSQAQRYRIIKNADGSYRFIPQNSAFRGLDVAGNGNVQLWDYWGTNNQRWVFEKANFGNAPTYSSIQTTSQNINCGGFALRTNEYVNGSVLGVSSWATVEIVATKTIEYFNKKTAGTGRTIRRIAGVNHVPTYTIASNEYRVALRVVKSGTANSIYDYHYMIQINDGTWAHKPGSGNSEHLGYINPTTYDWTYVYSSGAARYNSDVIYFAVSR
jgi:hypothetical protein